MKLDELGHRHIAAFVTSELAAGRGKTTLYRCPATLSSALGDAVRHHRPAHNPASPPSPAPATISRAEDLDRERSRPLPPALPHQADTEMSDLFEFLSGTGMHAPRSGTRSPRCSPPTSTSSPRSTRTAIRSPTPSSGAPTSRSSASLRQTETACPRSSRPGCRAPDARKAAFPRLGIGS